MTDFDYQTLDDVVHSRVRLAIMAFLATVERAEFGVVRDDAGYVAVTKRFVARKPQSLYVLTEAGRTALLAHIERLEALLGLGTAMRTKP